MSYDRNNRDDRPRDNYRRDDNYDRPRDNFRRDDRQGGDRNFGGDRPRYGDRDGDRPRYGGDRGYDRPRFDDRRGGDRGGRGGFQDRKPKWTVEQETELKQIVETMKQNGAINWDQVGQQCGNRFGSSCFNKYIQLTEPEWTSEQDDILGKYWEENNANFDITAVLPQLDGHTKRGTQFRLERLTEEMRGGKYKPQYRMGKDEMQKSE